MSILPIWIIVCRDDTWARDRQNCLGRLDCTRGRPWRWTASLMDSSWVSWRVWQISHWFTEMWDCVEGCLKRWDWSWGITARGSHLNFKCEVEWIADGTMTEGLADRTAQKWQQTWKSDNTVRRGSHRGGSPQNGLGDKRTCGTTLASAYVLHRLSATWSQLQMKKRKSEWKWVLIGVSLLNTGDRVQSD